MDLDNLKSEVLHPLEQAVHGRLIGIRSSEFRHVAFDQDIDVREGLAD